MEDMSSKENYISWLRFDFDFLPRIFLSYSKQSILTLISYTGTINRAQVAQVSLQGSCLTCRVRVNRFILSAHSEP